MVENKYMEEKTHYNTYSMAVKVFHLLDDEGFVRFTSEERIGQILSMVRRLFKDAKGYANSAKSSLPTP